MKTLWLGLCLFLLLASCQHENAQALSLQQVLAKLEENADQPYGCRMVAELQAFTFEEDSLDGIQASTEFYHQKRWVSCLVSDFAINLQPSQRLMEKRMNGIVHRLEDNQPPGDLPFWECASFPKSSTALAGYDIYPPGGWDLCSQARGLLIDFPPDLLSLSGDVMEMSWEHIRPELRQHLFDGFPEYGRQGDFSENSITSLTLAVDLSQGVPVRFAYTWSHGESWSLEFQNFALLEEDYEEKLQQLRSRMSVPIEIGCFCDGEIYDIELELPERQ